MPGPKKSYEEYVAEMSAEEARAEVLKLHGKLLRYRTRAERAEDRYLKLAPHVHAMAYAIGITPVPTPDSDTIMIYPRN